MTKFVSFKVVIPARFASTRLPGKPLLKLCEMPMYWHVVQQVLNAGFDIDDIVLATDDQRIFDSAVRFSVPVLMTRSDHSSGTDRLNEVASIYSWPDETLVFNVQGDEPMIPSLLIKQLKSFAESVSTFDVYTAITHLKRHEDAINPNVVKVALGESNRAIYFSRAAIPFHRDDMNCLLDVYKHIGVYAYSVRTLRKLCSFPTSALERHEKLEQLRALSNGLTIGTTVFHGLINHGVDTYSDYEKIKSLMEK